MPAIARIRFTNVIYEGGAKRYQDELFNFDGHNGIVLLENGGGKTVFVQTALQAVLPHIELAKRKVGGTLSLSGGPAHIAIEWILHDKPRRYGLTAVTLFLTNDGKVDSYRYAYEYEASHDHSIEYIPFVRSEHDGGKRPAGRGEMLEYYKAMCQSNGLVAKRFDTITEYQAHLEDAFKIVTSEWESIAHINCAEGDVDAFFSEGRTTTSLVEQLLMPTVERTIPGRGADDFVENFELQRTHFKKHKDLRERIKENQEVEVRMEKLFEHFEVHNRVEEAYLNAQAESKSLFTQIINMQASERELMHQLEVRKNQILSDESEYNRTKMILEIEKIRCKKNALVKILNEEEEAYGLIKIENEVREKTLNELKIAKLQLSGKEMTFALDGLQKSLKETQEHDDISRILEEQALVGGWLKHAYEERLDIIQTEVDRKKTIITRDEGRFEELQDNLKRTQEKVHKNQCRKIEIETNIANILKQSDDIAKKIVPGYPSETVLQYKGKCKERLQDIVAQKLSATQKEQQLSQRLTDLDVKLELLRNDHREKEHAQLTLKSYLEQADEEQRQVQIILGGIRNEWSSLVLHQKQNSLYQAIDDKITKVNKQLEQLRILERKSNRWLDDYSGQSLFMADPYLKAQVERFGNQFSFVMTGPEFLKQYAESTPDVGWAAHLGQSAALWAMGLVVEKREIETVYDRLLSSNDDLLVPVLLISLEDAYQALEQGGKLKLPRQLVFPQNWVDNMDASTFENWIDHQKSEQTRLNDQIKQKEDEKYNLNRAHESLKNYYHKYPNDQIAEKKVSLDEVTELCRNLEANLWLSENERRESHEEQRRISSQIQSLSEEEMTLGSHVQDAFKWEELFRQNDNNNKDLNRIDELIEDNIKELRSIQSVVDETKERIEEGREGIRELEIQHGVFLKEEIYNDVTGFDSILKGNESLEMLKSMWRNLTDRLNQSRGSIKQLEEMIKSKLEDVNKNAEEQNQFYLKWNLEEKQYEFPIDGDFQLNQLERHMANLSKQLREQYDVLHAQKEEIAGIKGKLETNEENARNAWGDNLILNDSIDETEDWLALEEPRIDQEFQRLKREQRMNQDQLLVLDKNYIEMDKNHSLYRFNDPSIPKIDLQEQVLIELPYKLTEVVGKNLEILNTRHQAFCDSKERVDNEKSAFKEFCKNRIKDFKLQERAIKGMEESRNLQELFYWREMTTKTLHQIIRLAEDDLAEHDKQLTTFINQMQTHLTVIGADLGRIPRCTRVRQGDGWKEIFRIDVPEWDEHEGREKLKAHIDKLLDELESPRFAVEEQGNKDTEIRKHIERNLRTSQLFGLVTNRKPIHVKCRKVSSDGLLSERYFSWEESNIWSGGEKWSKNMALFLGLLNYVAEKRKLIERHGARSRSVILDNPFGKASSDHVLRPVFFVAEQLGFQIIALTAHDDGRFIRDYFPVIYSCRLMPLVGSDKKAVTKDLQIATAWLQEHDPASILRLGEQRQLEVFDYLET